VKKIKIKVWTTPKEKEKKYSIIQVNQRSGLGLKTLPMPC